MHALLAFRRPNPEVPLGFDVGFEIRQMTCFNGFNAPDAFRTVTPPTNDRLSLILVGGEPSAAFYAGAGPRYSNRPWEFIALGWLSNVVSMQTNFESFSSQRARLTSQEWMAQILNREHITGHYRDWHQDRQVTGMRDRTPNEVFLGNLLHRLQQSAKSSWSQGFDSNQIAWALQQRAGFHYSLYDFVGSERPSGLAVAYLQVYRNVSSAMFDPSTPSQSLVRQTRDLVLRLDRSLSQSLYHSYIPVLSAMINNGSDSDIFSFASASALPLQIMKHGTFSIGEFMNNPAPMSREGRYVKGAQSTGLADKIRAAVTRSGQNVTDIGLARLGTIRTTLATFSSYCDVSRATTYGIDSFITGIESQFRALRNLPDITELPTTIRTALAAFVDLRAPVAPTARVAGAANGFLQWAEQSAAVAGTVH